jgi:hypothetical protein
MAVVVVRWCWCSGRWRYITRSCERCSKCTISKSFISQDGNSTYLVVERVQSPEDLDVALQWPHSTFVQVV